MNNQEMIQWLRDNSAGIYRPAALAADVLEHALEHLRDLQHQRDELAWALFEVLDGVQDHDLAQRHCLGEAEEMRLIRARERAGHIRDINNRFEQLTNDITQENQS